MSVAFKLGTLVIRTIAKPIAETIKVQAKEHERFRKICIGVAQLTHRFDVGMRTSLLRTTVSSSSASGSNSAGGEAGSGVTKSRREVRPLNEAKAIDSGAKLISEAFLFGVAGGLIIFESWRSRRKENARREGVADAIEALQDEVEELRRRLALTETLHTRRAPMTPIQGTIDRASITDPNAIAILHPRLGDVVRAAARKVRLGERKADL
ncbi:hypothetical protein PYCC9005_002950 [Savitreella phatthalungensis]